MTRAFIVAAGADHGGLQLKIRLAAALIEAGHQLLDFGTDGPASVDYPDYAAAVCRAVAAGEADFGLLVCGTGNGMAIAANRNPKIRAGLATDVTTARLTRAHNNANVLALGARITGEEVALDILNTFLSTPYEGGRHDRRLEKLNHQLDTAT